MCVSVAAVHDAEHRMCVCGCQVRLEHLRCDVSHLIMDTCFRLSLPCARECVCVTRARGGVCVRVTGRRQRAGSAVDDSERDL